MHFSYTGKILGKGGFSNVYQIRTTEGYKALKSMIIEPNIGICNPIEMDILRRLNHPHLLHAEMVIWKEIDSTKEYLCFVLPEYKHTLQELCRQKLKPSIILNIMYQLCTAVNFLHENYILHLDIKPQNISMDSSNYPILGDFGLSCLGHVNNNMLYHNASKRGTKKLRNQPQNPY